MLLAAAPALAAPPFHACGTQDFRDTTLAFVNAVRAHGADCGGDTMPPAPPLAWNDALSSAATRHSADMAQGDYFDHVSARGERAGKRATAAGYRWKMVGENIAAGDGSLEQALRGWFMSTGHCRNLMRAEFRDIGVACASREESRWVTYWTMVLGRP